MFVQMRTTCTWTEGPLLSLHAPGQKDPLLIKLSLTPLLFPGIGFGPFLP